MDNRVQLAIRFASRLSVARTPPAGGVGKPPIAIVVGAELGAIDLWPPKTVRLREG